MHVAVIVTRNRIEDLTTADTWQLSTDATITLVTSLICSTMDYCNSIFAGLPNSMIDCLQSVLHAAARIIRSVWKYYHITPTLRDELHWLPVTQRISFKFVPDCQQGTTRHQSLHRRTLSFSSCHTLPIAAVLCNMQRPRCSNSREHSPSQGQLREIIYSYLLNLHLT